MSEITCGRCNSKFQFSEQLRLGEPAPECRCPMCGFSKKDVQESIQVKPKVLKG